MAQASMIHTVRGPVDPAALGRTLAHEHVTPAAAAETVHATWQSRAN